MRSRHAALCATMAAGLVLAIPAARAASPAAAACPPQSFLSDNLAENPNFEVADPTVPLGSETCWNDGDPLPPPSAADGWFMHSNNDGATVCSRLVKYLAPGLAQKKRGSRAIKFTAGGNEGGIYQDHALDPEKAYMFSVWVLVREGQVAIQSNALSGGPVAWTTKTNEWEQLRVCTNDLFNTNSLVIYNQAADGGVFFVDRVELREIPVEVSEPR